MMGEIGTLNPLTLALFIGAMSLLPLAFMITTSFLKIAMVLTLTRNALGVQQVPPNMAIYAIALASTLFIMAPVFSGVYSRVQERPIETESAEKLGSSLSFALQPITGFLQKNTNPDIETHLHENSLRMWPKQMAEEAIADRDNWLLLIPAFVLSELEAGFKIGFLIFIPFIVVDLIVSNVLLALGMQMVSPMTISLPLKILLFVLADGWVRLLDGLFYSYA